MVPYLFNDSLLPRVPVCEGFNRGDSCAQAKVCVSYWYEYVNEGIRLDLLSGQFFAIRTGVSIYKGSTVLPVIV